MEGEVEGRRKGSNEREIGKNKETYLSELQLRGWQLFKLIQFPKYFWAKYLDISWVATDILLCCIHTYQEAAQQYHDNNS